MSHHHVCWSGATLILWVMTSDKPFCIALNGSTGDFDLSSLSNVINCMHLTAPHALVFVACPPHCVALIWLTRLWDHLPSWQDCVHMVAEGHNSCVVIGLTYHLLGILDWASRNSTVSLLKCTNDVVVRLRAYWVKLRARWPRKQVFENKVIPCINVLVKQGFTFCLHGMHGKQWSVLA